VGEKRATTKLVAIHSAEGCAGYAIIARGYRL
jgi:hypothetical protein